MQPQGSAEELQHLKADIAAGRYVPARQVCAALHLVLNSSPVPVRLLGLLSPGRQAPAAMRSAEFIPSCCDAQFRALALQAQTLQDEYGALHFGHALPVEGKHARWRPPPQ